MNNVFSVWKSVFGNWRYLAIGVLTGFLFYALNGIIINLGNIVRFYGDVGFFEFVKIFMILSLSFFSLMKPNSFYTMIIISLMMGVLISLLFYRIKIVRKREIGKTGLFASVGLFLGVLAPGCAACGIGLASVLGISSALVILPFNGLEVSLAAICILSFSIYKVSKSMMQGEACEINLGKRVKKQW